MSMYEHAYIDKHERQVLHGKRLLRNKNFIVCLWMLHNLYFQIKRYFMSPIARGQIRKSVKQIHVEKYYKITYHPR